LAIDFSGTDFSPIDFSGIWAFLKIPLDIYLQYWMPNCLRKPCLLDTNITFLKCSVSSCVI